MKAASLGNHQLWLGAVRCSPRMSTQDALNPQLMFSSPIVGRDRELDALDDALAQMLAKQRLVAVTIIGAHGLGKTRLVEEFQARSSARERRTLILRSAQREHSDRGARYDPIARILRQRAGVSDSAPEAEVRAALEEMVKSTLGASATGEFLHVLGAFVGCRYPESPLVEAVEDNPAQRAALQHAVVRRFFEIDTRLRPIVLIVEDLERASDDALQLLRSLMVSFREGPLLLIASATPALLAKHPDWAEGIATHSVLDLSPLKPDDAARLVMKLLDPVGDVPEELIETAVDVAAGSPSLIEQMIRAYVASGTLAQSESGKWEVHLDRIDQAQLPLTVHDAVNARIAALSPVERDLLEHAAVLGGVFWLGALVSLGRMDRKPPELWGGGEDLAGHYRDLLLTLRDRDYVLAMPDASMPGEEEFAFKHNLEREALYGLLHPTHAKRLHLHAAEWLESRFPGRNAGSGGRSEEHSELLASHFEYGGAGRSAALYWLEAADLARARFANVRATELYERALPHLGHEDAVRQLDALHNLGDVLQLSGRNDDAIEAFERMRQLAFRLDLKAKGGVAHNRIGRVYRAIGHLDAAMRHLGTGHALFDAAQDQRGVASSLDDVGKVHWMRGAYEPAERFLQRGLELRRELGDARSIALSLNNLGLVYHDSGRFDAARDAFSEAIHIRREIGDRSGIAQSLNNLGSIHQDQGEHARAAALYRDALDHARAVGDRMRQAVILTNLGESHYRQAQPEQAIQTLREAEATSASLGDRILEGEILRGLAKAHMLTNDLTEARALITRSIDLFEQAKGKPFLAVALRTAGEIEQASGWGGESHQRARQAFERSIHLLEEVKNESELARSCTALAALLELDGDPVHAPEIARLRARAGEVQERLREASVPEEATDPNASVPG